MCGKPRMCCRFLRGLGPSRRLISRARLKVPHGGAQCTQRTSGLSSSPFSCALPDFVDTSTCKTLMPLALHAWSMGTALKPRFRAALLSLATPQKTSTKTGVLPDAGSPCGWNRVLLSSAAAGAGRLSPPGSCGANVAGCARGASTRHGLA